MKTLASGILSMTLMCLSTRAIADTFGTATNEFEIEFVEMGDPGNTADRTSDFTSEGSVDYVYSIGKFEISRDMIEQANAHGGLGLSLHPMDFVPGGPRPDMPATGVSLNGAARFTNWLNTSQGLLPAYKFNAQPGDVGYDANENIDPWVVGEEGFDPANPLRNSQAMYFLPSLNEWIKAAYFDPNANDGAGSYWDFATGSDKRPTPVASGTAADTAVYNLPFARGPADATLAGGLSPYGVMGLGGNVVELLERGRILGGSWAFSADMFVNQFRGGVGAGIGDSSFGFRVVSIPEPNALLGDCNDDGKLDVADLSCVATIENRDVVLAALNTNPGDLDGNGDVDFADFLSLSANFGIDQQNYTEGNIDLTGAVDFTDFLILAANFGQHRPVLAASVPEPAPHFTLLLGALLIAVRPRLSCHRQQRVGTGLLGLGDIIQCLFTPKRSHP